MDDFLGRVYDVVLQPVIFLIFGIAFLIFIWGLVMFMKDKDNEKEREIGKQNIIWGIVGMVIMVSVFGIINVIAGTIGVTDLPVDESEFRQDIEGINVE